MPVWHELTKAHVAAGRLAVLGITLILLLQANRIYGVIGNAGATLLVRVLGLILAALAVEMVLEASSQLLPELRAA